MQKKKLQILEAAMRLFARQGFHATSIQEIVDELGMAKGSIYFYFKSKDELLLSIFEYYGEQLYNGMAEQPGEEGLSPREALRVQLERQIRFIRENVEFIQMLIKEPLIGVDHVQLKSFAFRFRSRYLNWLNARIQAIYGNEAERYWADGVLILSGMMNDFMQGLLIDRDAIQDRRLSDFLVRRLDDVMRGMMEAGEPPIMGQSGFRKMIGFGTPDGETEQKAAILAEIKGLAEGTDSEETVALLEAELNKAVPHRVVVRAMLALLEKQAEPEWNDTLQRLGRILEA
ncbi:TetR/AcrR family transcriptional regulator [Cohnella candidum]|uniref:TetR/AcrR family transcriptional regulator n=1 Tax=Cohnella candidum TaxID=2674991 RepID=A0A3G3JXQ8_9BACL|nr:TetR/AcrR family transcriptional regulator [Cohnella candidum]AYQ73014.1 TetR/AcrR family transcriptional regulator [Cohnella candidum]